MRFSRVKWHVFAAATLTGGRWLMCTGILSGEMELRVPVVKSGRGVRKSGAFSQQPALAVSVSRANSNFEGKDACRGHEHRARRRESLAPTGIIRPDLLGDLRLLPR